MDQQPVGPEPKMVPSLAERSELASRYGADQGGADRYGPDWIKRYWPSPSQVGVWLGEHPDADDDELMAACEQMALANDRAGARPPESRRPPKRRRRPVATRAVAHHRRTHRVGHRGPVARRPGARRTRRAAERAGPDDDPGPGPRAVGGRP